MTTNYYYDCTIKATYIAKHFGMKLWGDDTMEEIPFVWVGLMPLLGLILSSGVLV